MIEEESFTSIYRKHFADLRSVADWLVYKHCSGEAYYYFLLPILQLMFDLNAIFASIHDADMERK